MSDLMTAPAPEGIRSEKYEAAWRAACTLIVFHPRDIAPVAGVTEVTVREYVGIWERAGAIRFASRTGHKISYEVIEPGSTVPAFAAEQPGTRAEMMWRTARILKSFTPRDIVAHIPDEANVTERMAIEYCQMLLLAGYARVTQKGIPGRRLPTYRLHRDTGPRAPSERRVRAVWDPNLDDYTHVRRPLQ